MVLQPEAVGNLQNAVLRDSAAFAPELILCGGIVFMLLMRLVRAFDRWHLGWVALAVTATALFVTVGQWNGTLVSPGQFLERTGSTDLFSGLLVYDHFTLFLRLFLLLFLLFIIGLSLLTGIPDREDSGDFYTLLLGATVGMAVMASTNHLLMMFIGVEMASLPSYALAGFLKGKRQSSEAALKYVVYGGGAAGVMLYGISLLAGRFGTAYLPDLAAAYVAAVQQGGFDSVLVLGTLFVIIGIAFKLAAVPFHFWCPDVFEGASAEVAGFLSVASKGAALALLARFALAFGGAGGFGMTAGSVSPDAARHLVPVLAFLAILTATFGNLAAYKQTNLKRLLAYSTIAHAGYMMMAVATLRPFGVESMLVYLAAYLLMNLGAFAVVAFLRNQTGSEDLADFRGLVRRSPWMVITLSIFLLSLLGVPPLAGFIAKFQVFAAVLDAAEWYRGKVPSLTPWLYVMLAFGLVNSVASAVYYVKVMKVMIIDARVEDVEGKEPVPLREPAGSVAYSALVAGLVCLFLVFWTPLQRASQRGATATERVAGRSGGER